MTARSAWKDLELEALISTIATLNNRVVELEGGDTTTQAVFYNLTQTPGMFTFNTHRTSRDTEGTDVLELVPLKETKGKLLPGQEQQSHPGQLKNAGQSDLEFHTIMMHKLLLILFLFHGLVKMQSTRLNLRPAESLTSRTALLLT